MEQLTFVLPFIAHTLIGFYFLFFGFWNIYHWRTTMNVMMSRNLPHPWLFLSIAIGLQIVCGFMIALNFYIKLAALILIPFTLFAVYLYYPFWKFRSEQRILHFSLFVANLTMTVAALILLLNDYSAC